MFHYLRVRLLGLEHDAARGVDDQLEERDLHRQQHQWHLSVPAGGKIVLEVGPSKIEMSDSGIRLTAPRIDLN